MSNIDICSIIGKIVSFYGSYEDVGPMFLLSKSISDFLFNNNGFFSKTLFEFNSIGVYVSGGTKNYVHRLRLYYQQIDRIKYYVRKSEVNFFDRFPNLCHVEVWNCKTLKDEGIKFIVESLPKLKGCSFRNCRSITNKGMSYLPKRLKYLEIVSCMTITDGVFRYIPKSVCHLNLTCCWYIEDKGMKSLSKNPNITTLILRRCNYLTEDMAFLLPLTLSVLDVSWITKFSNESLKEVVSKIPDLRELYMAGCQKVTDTGLHLISYLNDLRVLDLTKSYSITDHGLEHLPKTLVKLSLEDMDLITDKGLKCLPKKRLRFLNLRKCNKLSNMGLKYVPDTVRVLKVGGTRKITETGLQRVMERNPFLRVINNFDEDELWIV